MKILCSKFAKTPPKKESWTIYGVLNNFVSDSHLPILLGDQMDIVIVVWFLVKNKPRETIREDLKGDLCVV